MKRLAVAFCLLYVVAVALVIASFASINWDKPDTVAINDIVMSHSEDALVDALVAYQDEQSALLTSKSTLLRNCLLVILTAFAVGGFYLLYTIDRQYLKPFRELQSFAQNVASGNLNIPLRMNRSESFGAFTESFDLMRDELARAREAERHADLSKKELVASLSHDIKTPVASIKAATELMSASISDPKQLSQLQAISNKANQIDTLITNLFSATLEDLQELPVTPTELPSLLLETLIEQADYQKRAPRSTVPECIIIADPVRLAQVLDNIFENSYKYANTAIEVTTSLENDTLNIAITDFGPGVSPEELTLLCQKFYRGSNATNISGSGLGLYLAKHFMQKMHGDLQVMNNQKTSPTGSTNTSFTVALNLTLA